MQHLLSLTPTERGFLNGKFLDLTNTECSLQKSSLASSKAVWLGPNLSRDGKQMTSHRMHLTWDQVSQFIDVLDLFAIHGEAPKELISFRDRYNSPVVFLDGGSGLVSIGIVHPRHLNGAARIQMDPNTYTINSRELDSAVQRMFDEIRVGKFDLIQVDNRMVLNRAIASNLSLAIRVLIQRKGDDGISLDSEAFPKRIN